MREKVEDFEIELPDEDSPIEILNEPDGQDLFEYDLQGDDSSNGIRDTDLKDMLPDSENIKINEDEDEIDLGMDEIGDLVDDLKLDVQNDETDSSEEGEEDMVFEEQETENEIDDSVESLLDDLGEDEDESESEEITISDLPKDEEETLSLSESEEMEMSEDAISDKISDQIENQELSAGSSEELPTESLEELSAGSSEELPTESSEEIPTESLEELSAGSSEELSTESSEELPTEFSEELPTESSEELSAGSSEELSTESSEELSAGSSVESPEKVDKKILKSEAEALNEQDNTSDGLENLAPSEDEISSEEADPTDIDLGMEEIDDTKEDMGDDIDVAETEIDESLAEEIGIVESDKENSEDWFENPEVEEDTIEELEQLGEKMDSLHLEDSQIEIVDHNYKNNTDNSITEDPNITKNDPSPLGSDMLLNFHHEVAVEIARTQLTGEEITHITYGSVIELDKDIGEPVNLVLDGKTIAHGEIVQINKEKLGIRIVGVVQE